MDHPSQYDEDAIVVEDYEQDDDEPRVQWTSPGGEDFQDSFQQQYDKIFSDSLVFRDLKDSVLSQENGEDSFLAIKEETTLRMARR